MIFTKKNVRIVSVLLAVLLMLICDGLLIACPPPDCGPCYAWNGIECAWTCGFGTCCNGECCNGSCCNGSCCIGGTCCGFSSSCCTSTNCKSCVNGECVVCNGDPCKSCVNGQCVYNCVPGQCCTPDGCKYPDTNWTPTASISVQAHPDIVSKVNQAINMIPGVSGVAFQEVVGSVSAKRRECCSASGIQHEICGDASLALSATLGRIKIWGPPPFVQEVNFGSWGANIMLDVGAYLSGSFEVSGTAGRYINECTNGGCLYGSASIGSTLGASLEGTACCCVKVWGTNYCGEASASGGASISFDGSVRVNQCGACDGLHGEFTLNDIVANITVTITPFSGSVTVPIYSN